MRDKILQLVKDAVTELNEELGYPELEDVTENTGLLGGDNPIDSLSMVSLIVDMERRVADAFDKQVVLADEKAMSMRNSPYRTVGTLVDFVQERLGADQ